MPAIWEAGTVKVVTNAPPGRIVAFCRAVEGLSLRAICAEVPSAAEVENATQGPHAVAIKLFAS